MFKPPRLPLDPFHNLPWPVVPPVVLPQSLVVLCLGTPTNDVLETLLSEPHTQQLILIATHAPLTIDTNAIPPNSSVRVLKLRSPLNVHDSGAVRLAALLEGALGLSRTWRASTSPPPFQELSENGKGGFDSLPPTPPPSSSKRTRRVRLPSGSSFTSHSASYRATFDNTPFDAILNFMPSLSEVTSEKALLKNAILVTTISQPFLVPISNLTPPVPSFMSQSRPSSRTSLTPSTLSVGSTGSRSSMNSTGSSRLSRLFARSGGGGAGSLMSASAPQTPMNGSRDSLPSYGEAPPRASSSSSVRKISSLLHSLGSAGRKAHIIHVMPKRSYDKRIASSIEQFLMSFSFSNTMNPGGNNNSQSQNNKPVSYLISSTLLSSTPSSPSSVPCTSVLNLVLGGALDPTAGHQDNTAHPHPMRTWVSSLDDIMILTDASDSPHTSQHWNGGGSYVPPRQPLPTFAADERMRTMSGPASSLSSMPSAANTSANTNAPGVQSRSQKRSSHVPRKPSGDSSHSHLNAPHPRSHHPHHQHHSSLSHGNGHAHAHAQAHAHAHPLSHPPASEKALPPQPQPNAPPTSYHNRPKSGIGLPTPPESDDGSTTLSSPASSSLPEARDTTVPSNSYTAASSSSPSVTSGSMSNSVKRKSVLFGLFGGGSKQGGTVSRRNSVVSPPPPNPNLRVEGADDDSSSGSGRKTVRKAPSWLNFGKKRAGVSAS